MLTLTERGQKLHIGLAPLVMSGHDLPLERCLERLVGAVLLDFFPSTFHFESLIFLERK